MSGRNIALKQKYNESETLWAHVPSELPGGVDQEAAGRTVLPQLQSQAPNQLIV